MTWYTTGVLYLPAQLLVPLLIASIFWILCALLKSVSQILAQPSAAPTSNLISASVKEWSTGLKKLMVILLFTSERDGIFPHISLPVSSKCCLWDTFWAVQCTSGNYLQFSTDWPLSESYSYFRLVLTLKIYIFVVFVLLIQHSWIAVVPSSCQQFNDYIL